MIKTKPYGTLPTGDEITEYTLTNSNGMRMSVINYGCTITRIEIPDAHGNLVDVVLGYDTLEEYLQSTHNIGCIVGRCAGRIAFGKFEIENKSYQLSINHGQHQLHGGIKGFDKVAWKAIPFENEEEEGIGFHYVSQDGEEGFPGNVTVRVRYFLSKENAIVIDYSAETDAPTIINLTQHTYFNLSGGKDSILKHALQINAGHFLPVDEQTIPTGEIHTVEDTPFDFRTTKVIGAAFLAPDRQIQLVKGLDHCYVLGSASGMQAHAASLFDLSTQLQLDVYTTEPGVQVYTGNFLNGKGKGNIQYKSYSGICLETQHFPDAPNHKHFPSIVLTPGETYRSLTIWKWTNRRE